MLTKNLTPFLFGSKVTSLQPPQLAMTMIVRASFVLRPGEPLTPIEDLLEQGSMTGDVFRPDDDDRAGECLYASDFADFKLHAEVLLAGACHAPGGRPVTECPVRFSVGAWSKTLLAVGRRVWTQKMLGASISEPEPFVTLPLVYAEAFGGPTHAVNPVGKGRDTPELPGVEYPATRVRSKGDRPEPAGFGPINPSWPQRFGKMGKQYGARWRKERAPFFSEDFDWTYFNAAPADQQLQGYLRGDEEISFVNLHPEAHAFSAKLPGLRIRAFARDTEGTLREARMNLDTLVADLDGERLVLTWRGLVYVKEDDLADVKSVLVASESLADAPLSEVHYREILDVFEADPLEMDKFAPGAREALAALDAIGKDDAAHPERTQAERSQAVLAHSEALVRLAPSDQQAGVRSSLAGTKVKLTAVPNAPPPDAPAPSPAEMGAAVARVSGALQEMRSRGEVPSGELAELERMLEDPQTKQRLASLLPPSPEEIGPGKDLSDRNLAKMDLSGRDLSGANLEGANLMEARLVGARLVGANLNRAILVNADLERADLSRADLTLAILTDAHAAGADLRGATLDQTIFNRTDLRGAMLAEARGKMTVFTGADLTEANLQGCDLWKAIADGAVLVRADFSKATLTQCLFLEAKAEGVTLTKAELTGTTFSDGDLRGANVLQAHGEGSNWTGTALEDADFRFAVLPSAHFTRANVAGARFFGADLRGADLYRACLDRADFERANLAGANLGKSTLHGTRFVRSNLYDARFLGAGGKGCDLEGANVKRATLPS